MIELENCSPFPAMVFEKAGFKNQWSDVLAIKGTFRLKVDSSRADLANEQRPLVMADEYWGDDPLTCSLRYETDLVLGKLRTDVHVVGSARTVGEERSAYWDTSVEVGPLKHALRVHGPRHWYYRRLLWRMSDAQLVAEVPLRYEQAYGGTSSDREVVTVHRPNPIGKGFYPRSLDSGKTYPAAQLSEIKEPWLAEVGAEQPVCGYGPLSRWWPQRAQYAGTYDKAWQDIAWPFLPADFNPAFYNSAPSALQAQGFLLGNEAVTLTGLLPDANVVRTALPDYRPVCVCEDKEHTLHTFQPRLDTVTIDLDERLIFQTWRLTLPRSFALTHVVLGAIVPPSDRTRPSVQPIVMMDPRRLNPEKYHEERLSWLFGKDEG